MCGFTLKLWCFVLRYFVPSFFKYLYLYYCSVELFFQLSIKQIVTVMFQRNAGWGRCELIFVMSIYLLLESLMCVCVTVQHRWHWVNQWRLCWQSRRPRLHSQWRYTHRQSSHLPRYSLSFSSSAVSLQSASVNSCLMQLLYVTVTNHQEVIRLCLLPEHVLVFF